MNASDVMTERVISVGPDASIVEAIRLMLQDDISGLPVIDASRKLVGVVTEGDFLRRAETGTARRRPRWLEFFVGPGKLAEEYARAHARKVSEVMTPDPVTIAEDTPLSEAVDLMERHHIKRLPVMRGPLVVGILTRASLLRALASVAAEVKPATPTDSSTREQILSVLKKEPWAPTQSIDVTVRNGIADLWGSILDERERKALIVAVENVPGVREVRDHLAWIEPASGMVVYSPDEERKEKRAG
jgi:CBS domain-containing protein